MSTTASPARLLRLFEELNRQGTTIVVATHNEGIIARFAIPGSISRAASDGDRAAARSDAGAGGAPA